ncbi:hypothetical protein SAMN04515668_4525 [Hymenobacter arizonensis]|uniref:REase associating with pPIWI RE domain-containing protein n=1 Tax=Hymenobacter arizonensis TaxID=1227077 RepID=A0A1I6BGB6_HYMAR|nr:hypothetical protein SAMN04515668_4525 [Hymenobacter arizonensis]
MEFLINLAEYGHWKGTPQEACREVAILVNQLFPSVVAPTERVMRDWRSEGLLTRSGHKFSGRNILEAVYVAHQRTLQLSVSTINLVMSGLSDNDLCQQLLSPAAPLVEVDPIRVEKAVVLLAHGVLRQFQAIREGKTVGISADIPLPLRQAQAHFARFAFEQGQADTFASVHEVLACCTRPLAEWAPAVVRQDNRFASAVLLDPAYRVPSEDCGAIAELGSHAEDVVEKQLYRLLMQALESLGEAERDAAYLLVREFIAKHPLVTREELRELRNSPRLSAQVAEFFDLVYEPAHAAQAEGEWVRRCGHCNSNLLPAKGTCTLASCHEMHHLHPLEGVAVPTKQALLARPEIRKYWCDPAQEELRLYNGLRTLFGDTVQLYPHQDRCDVAIGDDIGIDVKDYQDPVSLARKLNHSLGGLRLYPRKILAVATRRAGQAQYLDRLREQLLPPLRRTLQVLSVDQVLKILKEEQRHG